MGRYFLSYRLLLLPLTLILVFVGNYILSIIGMLTQMNVSYNTIRSTPTPIYDLQRSEELEKFQLVPKDVFYFWCGPTRKFEFRHYLSVQSVFAYLTPYRVIFFYENEPINEQLSHDTWLQEIRDQYAYFSTDKLSTGWCDNAQQNMEKYLADNGGIFVHEEVILTSGFGNELYRDFDRMAVLEDGTNTILLRSSSQRNIDATKTDCVNSITTVEFVESRWQLWEKENIQNKLATVQTTVCNQPKREVKLIHNRMLVKVNTPLFPEQIWELDSETGRQLRNVAYGKPDLARPVQDFTHLAPNIAHVVWSNSDPMTFQFYLCVLSLLDVAKVDKVYLHGNGPPTGMYWDLIKEHPRLRLVKRTVIDGRYERVYGNTVNLRQHVVDILRLDILNRYGGLYVDTDAIFFRPLTRDLRTYDAVVSPDITQRNGFPDTFQNGIMLGKAGAKFWRLMIESNKQYFDNDLLWNSGVSIYKVKERHPTAVLNEPRLNTICDHGKCYPTWERRLRTRDPNLLAEAMKQWRNSTFAIHHTWPDLQELESHKALLLNGSTTLMGEVGMYVLEKAGKLDFFKNL